VKKLPVTISPRHFHVRQIAILPIREGRFSGQILRPPHCESPTICEWTLFDQNRYLRPLGRRPACRSVW